MDTNTTTQTRPDGQTDFAATPLLSPERIATDPHAAFAVVPPSIRQLKLVWPAEDRDFPPVAVIVIGKKHLMQATVSATTLAILCELSRVRISPVTDTDGKGRLYVRLSIFDRPDDLTSLFRVLLNATPYQQTKIGGPIKSDLRVDNLYATTGSRLGKEGRNVIIGHANRLATKERLPAHITPEEYLANLNRLLEFTDLERQGLDPLASLPLTGVAQ